MILAMYIYNKLQGELKSTISMVSIFKEKKQVPWLSQCTDMRWDGGMYGS